MNDKVASHDSAAREPRRDLRRDQIETTHSSLIASATLLAITGIAPARADELRSIEGINCRPWTGTTVSYRDADGNTHVANDQPGLAKVVVETLDGSVAEQVVPPDGFRPEEASDKTPQSFGFPVPKTQGQRDALARYKRSLEPGLCTSIEVKSTTQSDAGWSGGVNYGHSDYYSADSGPVAIRQYDGFCDTPSMANAMVSVWAGLGDGNSHSGKLLQAGFQTSRTDETRAFLLRQSNE